MKAQMFNIRRTHKTLSFCRSFSFIRRCLVDSLSVDGSFLPNANQRTGFKLTTLCRIKSSSKTIFLKVHGAKRSLARSVGWTCMQSQSCCFVSVAAAALNNTTTSYHIELKDLCTLLKYKLAGIV